MREIVVDTETTGLDPLSGDRVVEIGCVELVNHVPTGRTFQVHVNPERDMPAEAQAVHGLTTEFLSHQKVFAEIAGEFLAFIGDAPLVMHNAAFDVGFLNHELSHLDGHATAAIAMDRVVDTLELARRKYPFGPNSLDALCRRYGIDNSERTVHGALLDCALLAEVYLELIGGRQPALGLDTGETAAALAPVDAMPRPEPLPPRLTEEEALAHAAFVATLGADAVWIGYGVGAAR